MQPSPDAELLASHSMANRAICPAIGLPVPTYLSTYLSIYPSIHLSIYLSSQPTVSLSDVFTSFGIQISTVETPFCMLSYSKLRKTLPFHMSMQPVCLPSHYSFSLMWNLLQNAQSITFSQVNATCVSPVQFYYILYAYQNAEHIVFSKVRVTCVSRPIFSYSLIRNLFQNAADVVFLQVNAACVAFLVFLYSLLHGGVVESPVFFQFPVSRVVERPVFFQFHLSVPVPFQFPFVDVLCFSRVCVAIHLFAQKKHVTLFPK